MTTIHILIAIDSIHQWHISQLDIKNTLLNGDLQEEVYMVSPLGVSYNPREVCRLNKTLHDLKQAPCAWFAKFFDALTSFGFHPSHHDLVLFLQCTTTGHILLILFVDDMIIIGKNVDGIIVLKSDLASHFEMKDLGSLWCFLGIKITSCSKGYLLSQSKYTVDILDRAYLIDTKTINTPLNINVWLSFFYGNPLPNLTLYHTIIGSLVYLTITRLNIAYVVYIN